jgi:hypothetical protein
MSTGRKRRASKAQMLLRLTEVWRVRLDGASIIDVAEYVAEKEQEDGSPWKLAEGEPPLSRRQIERFVQRVDEMIAVSTRERRRQSLAKRLSRREHMYGKAMNAGDVRTALAVEIDMAKLRGLYPEEKHRVKVKGGPAVLNIIETVVGREAKAPATLDHITEVVVTADGNTHPPAAGNTSAPGPTGIPPL